MAEAPNWKDFELPLYQYVGPQYTAVVNGKDMWGPVPVSDMGLWKWADEPPDEPTIVEN